MSKRVPVHRLMSLMFPAILIPMACCSLLLDLRIPTIRSNGLSPALSVLSSNIRLKYGSWVRKSGSGRTACKSINFGKLLAHSFSSSWTIVLMLI